MKYEIRNMITFDGSGAYIKIGFKWYRLEEVSPSEAEEANQTVYEREQATLKNFGLRSGP